MSKAHCKAKTGSQSAGIQALYKLLRNHPKHCTYWIFSGDRHCSCGRDLALAALQELIERADQVKA